MQCRSMYFSRFPNLLLAYSHAEGPCRDNGFGIFSFSPRRVKPHRGVRRDGTGVREAGGLFIPWLLVEKDLFRWSMQTMREAAAKEYLDLLRLHRAEPRGFGVTRIGLFDGRRVDLVTTGAISKYILPYVMNAVQQIEVG